MSNKLNLLSPKEHIKSLGAGLLTAVSAVCGMIPFLFLMKIIDQLKNGDSFREVLGNCLWIVLFLVLKVIAGSAGLTLSHKIAFASLSSIRQRLISHMKRLSICKLMKKKSGELAQIVNHEVEQIELFLAHALPELIIVLVVPATCGVILFTLEWRFALVLILSIPLLVAYFLWFFSRFSPLFGVYSKKTTEMSEDLLEYIGGIRVIKAFNKEEKKTAELLKRMSDYISWIGKMTSSMTIPNLIQSLIVGSSLVGVIIWGSILFTGGDISYKTFIIGIILGGFFTDAVAKMLTFTHKIMVFNRAKKNILSVLSMSPEESRGNKTLKESGDIVFKHTGFSYEEDKKVLHDISFTAKKESVTAIIGASGSGKSTIAHLTAGFLNDYSGSVQIAGKEIKELSEENIAEYISIVQQDVFLFNISISENIRLGNPDATDEDIYEAARKARLHDFTMSLPDGYDTLIGEKGAKLSGGEKQRISIARMILKDAPIIILDEATSAIDPHNEQLIQQAVSTLSQGKTVISIAHNMHTVVKADQIILLDKGYIEAAGSHKTLLENSEGYRQMVNAQNKVDTWMIKEGA